MTTLSDCLTEIAVIFPEMTDPDTKVEAIPLTDGFSNRVYLICWRGVSRLVLRIPGTEETIFYIDRAVERIILRHAVSAGLSPDVVWYNASGCMASRFVPQPSLAWTVRHNDNAIRRIASILKQVHALPAKGRYYSVFEVIQQYLNSIANRLSGARFINDEAHLESRLTLQKEYDYLVLIFHQLRAPEQLLPRVLCHNDINPKNLLMDDADLWVIDWEYAGIGDPLFDLAVVARSHNLDTDQQKHLLYAYDESLFDRVSQKRIKEAMQIYMCAYGVREMVWMLLKYMTTSDQTFWMAYQDFKCSARLNPFYDSL
ncbi:phosphotransferase [Marinomonas algarum]|uniref:Choline kinase family protein n=1 Tax=Marinomonas algarum TaxID=2883105 RepID=A0A9X1LE87_9GAMM|nr:phosphotransferase [Marinomonas algarum]MCB5160976.1 choline kinase family protein [Marinomonas algarum]